MKIVMVADQYPPIVGGTERQAQKLSRALVRRGHRVVVLTGRWRRDMPAREVDEGVEVERLSTLFSMGGIRGLRKFGRDLYRRNLDQALRRVISDVDVIHAHFMHAGAAVALEAARSSGVPVIVKETSSGVNNSFHRLAQTSRGKKMRGLFLRYLRHVAVLNDHARKEYEELPFEDLMIHKVPNGIEFPAGHPSWSPRSSRRLLFLGRLQRVKGAHVLLEAFASVAGQLPDWTLRICGEGPEEPGLREQATSLGIADRIEFRGVTDDPLAEIADCELLVMPSLAEGMSNTILEAMVVGAPILASSVGANEEMLQSDCGWTVPESDVGRLAEALVTATNDEEGRRRMGANAGRRGRSVYALDVVAGSMEAIYTKMITAGGSG